MDDKGLLHLLDDCQSGVVSRQQLLELEGTPLDLRRKIRRRELVVVRRGVYVNHTGDPSREQQAWAAVLLYWPAALTRASALPDPPTVGPIHVAVDQERTVTRVSGIVVHHTADFEARVRWTRSPPRIMLEHVVIDLASASIADPPAAFRVIADACQTRRTTPAAIETALGGRIRVSGRELIAGMLEDLRTGACSVLEREWLVVERAHGLPEGTRQVPSKTGDRTAYRDVEYEGFGLVVELDGRAYHDTAAARDAGADRDLIAAVEGEAVTVRLTYGQVFRTGCVTAARVAVLLRRRGWTGTLTPCASCA